MWFALYKNLFKKKVIFSLQEYCMKNGFAMPQYEHWSSVGAFFTGKATGETHFCFVLDWKVVLRIRIRNFLANLKLLVGSRI